MRKDWKPKFLEALAASPNVSAACRNTGIGRKTAYDARDSDPEFAEKWDEALESAVDDLAAEAFTRAKAGSDVLTIFLLKSHRPEVYRESTKQEIVGANGGPLQVQPTTPDLSKLTDAQLKTLDRMSRAMADDAKPRVDPGKHRRGRGEKKSR